MKILIVEDEILTRSGLVASIPWAALGIDEVLEASDGIEGLHQALLHQPDIILSDVRMPRMNGIEMLRKIREVLPGIVCIFMSGFPDREYLKAAIDLQAVSYVDKPLDPEEVSAAVRASVQRKESNDRSREAENYQQSVSASRLASLLTLPVTAEKEALSRLAGRYCARYGAVDVFRHAFTLLLQTEEGRDLKVTFLKDLEEHIHPFLRSLHLHEIGTEKHPHFFVLHFFRKTSFTEQTIRSVAASISKELEGQLRFYLVAGPIVKGILHLYDSYAQAVLRMQNAFFYPAGSILYSLDTSGKSTPAEPVLEEFLSHIEAVKNALHNAAEKESKAALQELYDLCLLNDHLIRRTIQVRYYSLVTFLQGEWNHHRLPPDKGSLLFSSVLEEMEQSLSFPELHSCLVRLVEKYFHALREYVPENSSVYLIKKYIQSHYGSPYLSTKEISEAAALSASYACSIFKNETGQTLNQYLTEYRMQKAKELLDDPRKNISEISLEVGYNDSNYFGKAFRKYTGLSPSEFRGGRKS